LREVSACPRGPKAVLFRLAKFLLEALPSTLYLTVLWKESWHSHDQQFH
jgi:hypothetical protein